MSIIQSTTLVLVIFWMLLTSYNQNLRKEHQDNQLQMVMEIEKSNVEIMKEINKNLTEIKQSMEEVHWSIENERK